ncbi:MAG: nucleotidyltransferase domain-containing protein [Deltaproteobacteria bacterium]|nr:nucleotidyltransferase domain-containing protein [Deltaproteobacteria bacterium]MBW2641508.1 nucleotidyltransferase domain-containing protein [Deltaproteobacteria bacterium]
MSSEKDIAINKARAFIELLKTNGIDIYEAYVFGSAIKDIADEYSDINIAVVSKDFSGMPYYDVKKISKYRRAIDLRLEIHPFSLKDINVDPPLFFMKIKNKGVRIH